MKPEIFDNTREEVREIAESLALFRSAMRHIAEREAARPVPATARRPRVRFLLHPALMGPALATAIFLASLPVYRYFRHEQRPAAPPVATVGAPATPGIADAELMSQIDAEVSEDAPDALQPMADFGSASSGTKISSPLEKKTHVTQE